VKGFQPCSPNTFFHPENKGETRFSQSENKKFLDTKNIDKKNTKKKKKKERHKDETSTNGRFKTNPTVVILGYLTPLTSSIKH
jgi:hypothetical protein